MDPLSISASIVALVQLTGTVIEYLHGVKGASEDRQNILSELSSVSGMLFILQDHADQQEDSWSLTLKSLNGTEGPLAQLRTSLELLLSKLVPVKGLKKVGKAFAWPFQKEEIKEILNAIERQKVLLSLAVITTDVRLAHFSVQEYLCAKRICLGPARFYSVQETESNEAIAQDCLAYLLHANRYSKTPYLRTVCQTLEEFPLVRYAATFWTRHARMAECDATSTISQLSMEFLLADGPVLLSIGPVDRDDTDPQSIKASTLGPEEIEGNEVILADFAEIDFREGSRKAIFPLYYASLTGLPVSVKMLIEKGANVNAQGGICGNALQAASYRGFEDVVQILLDNDVDVCALGGKYLHALQAASVAGRESIVQMLLHKGADINVQGGEHGTALQAAAYWGREDVVQVLLEHGADVNAPISNICSFSWHGATCDGLDRVCASDVRFATGRHGSALQAATCRGNERIVEMLLAQEADINAKGGEYGNALQAASYWGHDGIIKMLLAHETRIDAKEMNMVLWDACYNGDDKIVAIVLDDWVDGDRNPEDRDNVLRSLLRKFPRSGASFDMLLQWAVKTRNERVLQILAEVQTENDDSDRHRLEGFDSNSEVDDDSVQEGDHDSLSEEGRASLQEEDLGPVNIENPEPKPALIGPLIQAESLKLEDSNRV